jgi:hypothetical protein
MPLTAFQKEVARIQAMFARPPGPAGVKTKGQPRDVWYACGWYVREAGPTGINTWHGGLLDGTSSILVRRFDGLSWAVLFNTNADPKGEALAGLIDGLVHEAADAVQQWPAIDLFPKFLAGEAGSSAAPKKASKKRQGTGRQ